MTEPETNSEFEIIHLENVRVANNSVVFSYFKVFEESCIYKAIHEQYSKGLRFFLKFIIPQPNFSKKRFILITDEWTSNYFHWHFYALPKLLALSENNLIKDSQLLLPIKYRNYGFVEPSLKKFGIQPNQITYIRRKSHIKVSKLILVKILKRSSAMFSRIAKIMTVDAQKPKYDFGNKIYISREGQALRFVENESEVVEVLEKYGFKKIVIDKFPYDEQVAICSQANYMVSPHGAGLTNMLFMPEHSSVLELATYHDPEVIFCYLRFAPLANKKYFCQQCPLGEKSPIKDFHHASLVVDLAELEKNLKLMLGQN